MDLLQHLQKLQTVSGEELVAHQNHQRRNNLTNIVSQAILNNVERYTAQHKINTININNTENTYEL